MHRSQSRARALRFVFAILLGLAVQAGAFEASPARAESGADPLAAVTPEPPDADSSDSIAAAQVAPLAPSGRSALERSWFGAMDDISTRAAETRRRALELGVSNFEAAARALIATGREDDALTNRLLAVRIAPDLPLAHMALAAEYWRVGEYRYAITQTILGLAAVPRNLEASIWLAGTLLLMFAVVLVASTLVFIFVMGLAKLPNAAHDLGDLISREMPTFGRAALLASLVLLPFALGEGALGLVLALFTVAFVYTEQRQRMVLVCAVALLVLGAYPVLQVSGMVLRALDADPIAVAGLAVVRGTENAAQIDLLDAAAQQGDVMAAEMLGLQARRMGDDALAATRFLALLEVDPTNPLALTALGNIAYRSEGTDVAIDYYERALAVEDSALLLYNLAQAYAKAFRMEEYEQAMARAQARGSAEVAELSRFADTGFVADLPYPIASIRQRMIAAADGGAFTAALMRELAPGVLGRDWRHTGGGFLLAALVAFIVGARYQHAGRCARCGNRICARCDDSMWSSDLCDGCHHLFNRPQGTDPDLRMARLKELRVRESRVDKIATVASLILPGASGLLAKRPDLSLMGLLLFFWTLALFVWHEGIVPEPLVLGAAAGIAFILAGACMAVLYVGVLVSGLMIRRSL